MVGKGPLEYIFMDKSAKQKTWKYALLVLDIDKDSSKQRGVEKETFLKWHTMSGGGKDIQYVGPYWKLEKNMEEPKSKPIAFKTGHLKLGEV